MILRQDSVSDAEDDFRRVKLLNYKVHEHQIEKAWKRFENAGFKPLLIKGWAAAQYYDKPFERRFNDMDLAFAPDEFTRAVELAKELPDRTAIDLHCGMRHLDTLSFETLYAHSEIVKCGAADIRVLQREDHLRILCVHWLIDGGAKKDKLQDIYYAVKTRPADFDWEACLNVVSPTRRLWIVCTVGLACKYLNLDVVNTPFEESVGKLPKWLVEAVEKEWQSGTIIIPLHFTLHRGGGFWRQLKKRIPPNPIQATIEMEGEFDDGTRLFYQIGSFFQRLMPSLKRSLKFKLKNED